MNSKDEEGIYHKDKKRFICPIWKTNSNHSKNFQTVPYSTQLITLKQISWTQKKLVHQCSSGLCNWIFKNYIFPGKLPVYSCNCLQLVLGIVFLLWVQKNLTSEGRTTLDMPWLIARTTFCIATLNQKYLNYLHYFGAINSVSGALPNNFSRVHYIFEHCIMNSSECAGAGSLNRRAFLWWPQYPPGGKHDNILQKKIHEPIYNQSKLLLPTNFQWGNIELHTHK